MDWKKIGFILESNLKIFDFRIKFWNENIMKILENKTIVNIKNNFEKKEQKEKKIKDKNKFFYDCIFLEDFSKIELKNLKINYFNPFFYKIASLYNKNGYKALFFCNINIDKELIYQFYDTEKIKNNRENKFINKNKEYKINYFFGNNLKSQNDFKNKKYISIAKKIIIKKEIYNIINKFRKNYFKNEKYEDNLLSLSENINV